MGRFLLGRPALVVLLLTFAIVLLPVVVWLDLRNISDRNLRQQATSLNQVISAFRSYYASNVVDRINAAGGHAKPLSTFRSTPGGIPIPATLSIEMARLIGNGETNVTYRFVSRLPFVTRAPYPLDDFETAALARFEADKGASKQVVNVVGGLFDREIRVATPVVMGAACVACHNSHPDSPKTRLEGRRRARHPGDHRHPAAVARTISSVQVAAGLFRAGWRHRPCLRAAVAPVAAGARI